MPKALRKPALNAPGGYHDEFFSERVGQRLREQVTQSTGEHVCALRAVQVQGHRSSIPRCADAPWEG
jgi:hypothetical protein